MHVSTLLLIIGKNVKEWIFKWKLKLKNKLLTIENIILHIKTEKIAKKF